MTDSNLDLTRRKVLSSVGAVGVAGAVAGFGTSALFNDTEEFANNTLAAGTLDLRMDWEEHYSYPQIYGLGDPTEGLDVRRDQPSDPSTYTPLPDPQDPVVWVHDDDFTEYFTDTTIEAFPDTEGQPIQSNFGVTQPCDLLAQLPGDLGAYNDLPDAPTDPAGNGIGRTRNADTYDADADQVLPLVSLGDVKPGDYGEFTFSVHLCGNDGYLWLTMPDGLNESTGTTTDAELDAENDGTDTPNLASNIRTTVWYDDDCSNTINGSPEPVTVALIVDTSDSVDAGEMQKIADASNRLVEQLDATANTDVDLSVFSFGGSDVGTGAEFVTLRYGITDVSNYVDSNGDGKFDPGQTSAINGDSVKLLPNTGDGNTPTPHALDLAREFLNAKTAPERRTSIIYLGDGLPAYATSNTTPEVNAKELRDTDGNQVGSFVSDIFDGLVDDDGTTGPVEESLLVARDVDTGPRSDTDADRAPVDPNAPISGAASPTIRTVGVGTSQSTSPPDTRDFLTGLATSPGLFYDSAFSTDLVDLVDELIEDLNVVTGEEVFFRGTLEELAAEMPIPLDGTPMGDDFFETDWQAAQNGASSADPETATERNCFDASSTQCFGLAWWVPTSVGNEIQGDTVSFDLGFYAEQCRNNDGSM